MNTLHPTAEFSNRAGIIRDAVREVLEITHDRQKAQANANAFFTSVPYGAELRRDIEVRLPQAEVLPELAIDHRFAIFGSFGWMKSVDLARVDHPGDLRGADVAQNTVRAIIDSFEAAGFIAQWFAPDHEAAKRRYIVTGLSPAISENEIFSIDSSRLLGMVQFPGEQPMWFAKRATMLLDAKHIPIPLPTQRLQLPPSNMVGKVSEGLATYIAGQLALQEQGDNSVIAVNTAFYVYREAPDEVLDGTEASIIASTE